MSRYIFLGLIGANMTLTLARVYDLNVGILLNTIGVLLIANFGVKLYTKFNLKELLKKFLSKLKMKFGRKPSTPQNRATNFNLTTARIREDLNMSNGQHSVDRHRYHMISHDNDQTYSSARESVNREGSANSVSSRRSTHAFRQCSATTLKGTQCTFSSYNASGLCAVHSRTSSDRER